MTINKSTFWVEKLEAGGVKVEMMLLENSLVNCLDFPIVFIWYIYIFQINMYLYRIYTF